MSVSIMFPTVLLLATSVAAAIEMAELKPATLASFDRYVRLTEARMEAEVSGRSPFLWIDRQPEAARAALHARLQRGEIISERLETRDGPRRIGVDAGMIHHWIGTVLLPGVTLDRATAFVQNYPRYPQLFSPLIQRAQVLKATPDRFDVAMRTSMKKVLTVVIDADYGVEYRRISSARLYTRSVATNIHQVDHAGEPSEKRIPGDRSSGFLWRINTYCWFEARAEGTYEQCESVSLTRDTPFGLGWLINPFITGIPRETLEFTLGRVRDGLKP
jgi:hypothetical protein